MKNDRGSILIVTLAFVLVFTMFGFGSIYYATTQNEAATKQVASTRAFWLAEAGVQKALWEYRHNGCDGFNECSGSCSSCQNSTKTLEETINTPDGGTGRYEVAVNKSLSSIVSTGSFPDTSSNQARRKVRISTISPFNYAFLAKDDIFVHSGYAANIVDSYDSDLGDYNSDIGGGQSNAFSNGDIGSLGSSQDIIKLWGGIGGGHVKGTVTTGPGGTVDAQNFLVDSQNDQNLFDPPAAINAPPSLKNLSYPAETPSGDLHLPHNGIHTITAGNYKYKSISMPIGGELNIEGDVRLYVENNLSLGIQSEINVKPGASLTIYTDGGVNVSNSSKINNQTKEPEKFLLFSSFASNGSGVQIWNDSDFYGAIHAPDTGISITNEGELFGAFVGKSLFVAHGIKLHYDEALRKSIEDTEVVRWEECKSFASLDAC